MKGFEKDEKAIEAVRKHYHCNGKYICPNFHDCKFGDGCNTSYDCCECGADDYYEGYIRAIKDKEETK